MATTVATIADAAPNESTQWIKNIGEVSCLADGNFQVSLLANHVPVKKTGLIAETAALPARKTEPDHYRFTKCRRLAAKEGRLVGSRFDSIAIVLTATGWWN